jgi:glycosyltransferase involved in cell wall biosynthesis
MIVHAYTMVHNEEALMPYFMRHYSTFCQKITVLDNESTDRTAEIASRAGAEVIPLYTAGKHDVNVLRSVMNEEYKASRGVADWIVCAEGDEFFWYPKMKWLLEKYLRKAITLPQIEGFDMVADAPPSGPGQIYDEIKTGIPNKLYGKRGIFHPSIDINFKRGGHQAFPVGRIKESTNPDIKLLHYRYLGLPYFEKRYEEHRRRIPEESIARGWGIECLQDHRERYRAEVLEKKPLIAPVVP